MSEPCQTPGCGHARSEHVFQDEPCGAAFDGCEGFTADPRETKD